MGLCHMCISVCINTCVCVQTAGTQTVSRASACAHFHIALGLPLSWSHARRTLVLLSLWCILELCRGSWFEMSLFSFSLLHSAAYICYISGSQLVGRDPKNGCQVCSDRVTNSRDSKQWWVQNIKCNKPYNCAWLGLQNKVALKGMKITYFCDLRPCIQ